MVEDPVKKCPKCKKLKAQRVIAGASNFILKGGGWYSDLYSSSGGKKSESTSPSTSTSSTTGASTESSSPAPAAPSADSSGPKKAAELAGIVGR